MFSKPKTDQHTPSADDAVSAENVSNALRSGTSPFLLDAHKPSVISEGFVLTGDVVAKGILHIEGRVVGTIRCDSVNIGANGSVDGAIECKSLQIKGTVTGTCMCGELVLASTARVTAKVTYGLLTISRGAKTEGEFVSAGTGLAP